MRVSLLLPTAMVLVVGTAMSLAAQGAAPQSSPSGAPAQARPATPAATPTAAGGQKDAGEAYSYQPEGRRDPFTSLLGTGLEGRGVSRKGEGPAGISVNDISVRGVMDSRGGLIAMVQGPDNRTYIVHAGDKFLDGAIKSITPQGLIIVQDVNDPLSLVKQREIRKLLRSAEDAKK